jgi:sugar-specific transcriptional regulator TrmB
VNDIKTNADIFANRVASTIAEFKQDFEEAKSKFLKAAKKNPSWAIRSHGESVVYYEEAYKVIEHARAYLDQVGVEYATRKEAVQACLDYFRDSLVRAATDFPSSSAFTNGVDFSERLGVARAVGALEYLVDHEFI